MPPESSPLCFPSQAAVSPVSFLPHTALPTPETYCLLPQGVLARVYETVVMLMLLTLLVLGMVWVASAIVDNNKASRESLYGEKTSFLPTPQPAHVPLSGTNVSL